MLYHTMWCVYSGGIMSQDDVPRVVSQAKNGMTSLGKKPHDISMGDGDTRSSRNRSKKNLSADLQI